MTGPVLSVDQAAELAGLPAAELAELIAADAIPNVLLGTTRVIPTGAFTTWLDEQALVCWRLRAELAADGVHLGGRR